MNFATISFILYAANFARAQHAIELQLIGHEISKEEQSQLDFCEKKYCLLDSKYIFDDATQNKSVKPCEDFKEFALGTLIKYKALSDRIPKVSFYADVDVAHRQRIRRALASEVNENDSKITAQMKKLYNKCINSDNIRRNGVNEMRQYLKKFGLKFYPDAIQDDFDIKTYLEEQPSHALEMLFRYKLSRYPDYLWVWKAKYDSNKKLYFDSYKDLLYEIFQIYRNSSANAKIYLEEFEDIANKQLKFYELQNTFVTEEYGSYLTIDEINNLTSSLNLDWSKIFNNALLTKLRPGEKIWIDNPETMKGLANFLSTADKKSVADFVVYDFLFSKSALLEVYQNDAYTFQQASISKSRERWWTCLEIFTNEMNPALMYLFYLEYKTEMPPEAIHKFVNEAKDFLVAKIKAEAKWEEAVNKDLLERVRAIKLIPGYPEKYLKAEKIDELYSKLDLNSNEKFVESMIDITSYNQKILLEPTQSEVRKLFDLTVYFYHSFIYSTSDDILYIHFEYLLYPFYHYQRPQFFNAATVGYFLFDILNIELKKYLWEKHSLYSFDMLDDSIQVSYEFYDYWIKSGGQDLQLGAHRLTNQQLFWMAMAKVFYQKFPFRDSGGPPKANEVHDYDHLHRVFFKKAGFRDAFKCKVPFKE